MSGMRGISSFMSGKSLAQMKRYLVTGLLAFASEYGVFQLLLMVSSKFTANSGGMLVGFWVSFLLNRYWSFASRERLLPQLLRYSLLFIINLGISNGLMYLLSNVGNIPASIAKLMIMCMIVLWNFVIFKKLIYRK